MRVGVSYGMAFFISASTKGECGTFTKSWTTTGSPMIYGKAADELYQTCYKISIPPNLLIQTSSVHNTSSHSLLSSHCVSALKGRKYNYVITLEIKRADESMCTTSQQSWTKILYKVLLFQKILVGPSLTYFSHWRAWNIKSQSLLLAWLTIWWISGHSCQEKQLQKNKYTM